jgi:uncharacterized integral membrane protein
MRKAKLIAIVVISISAVIIVLQNTELAQARILFWTVQMSRALLLLLTFAMGFVAGILVPTFFLRKRRA